MRIGVVQLDMHSTSIDWIEFFRMFFQQCLMSQSCAVLSAYDHSYAWFKLGPLTCSFMIVAYGYPGSRGWPH